MISTASLSSRVRGTLPRMSLLAAMLVLAGCASTSPLMGGKSTQGNASGSVARQGGRSLLNPPVDASQQQRPKAERASIAEARMFAVDFGDTYGARLDEIRNNPAPSEAQREMLQTEAEYRNTLALLKRGDVFAAPHPHRDRSDEALQKNIYYDSLSVSNETYRQISARCIDAPYSVAGFNRCLAGHYEGRMHHANPEAPKEHCSVDISPEGMVQFNMGETKFPSFQIKYRVAGVDYAPSGDVRLARLYGFTGWREGDSFGIMDAVLGLRRETLMVDMKGVGTTREVQMRMELATPGMPIALPVYATCMITSHK